MLQCRNQLRIQWGDCDPAGIVYFPRYFEMFDNATIALLETFGLKKAELLRKYAIWRCGPPKRLRTPRR